MTIPIDERNDSVNGLRQQAEKKLQEAVERLDMAQRAARAGIWDWDVITDHIEWSAYMFDLFGIDSLETTASFEAWRSVLHPEDLEIAERRIDQALKQHTTLNSDYRIMMPDGQIRWINAVGEGKYDVQGRPVRMIGVCIDITARKQAEEMLRILAESNVAGGEDIFRFLVRQLAVSQGMRYALVALINPHDPGTAHTVAVWSGGDYADNFSYALAGAPCHNVTTQGNCFYPRDVQKLFPQNHLLVEMGAESYCGAPLRDSNGNVFGVLAVLDDHPMMGERMQILTLLSSFAARAAAEIERAQAEEKYQTLFQEMLDGFALHEIICDAQGNPVDYRFLAANPAFERLTGLKAQDLVGKTALQVLPGIEPYWIETYGRVALTGEPAFFENYAKGIARHYEVTAFRPAPNQFACIFVDITERKRTEVEQEKLQEQLVQAQKMESVGRLAGGVAHDFNNMLGVIIGHAEMAMNELDPAQSLHADLREILNAAQRSAGLTRQLLAFACKQMVAPKSLNLNDTVAGMLKMLQRLIGEDIDLVWQPAAGLWPVKMDPTQIDQILINLCVNARSAIAGVGKITVETENVTVDEAYYAVHADVVPGAYVMLAVSDNGCGMEKEVIEHIFEPFFTTKEVGEGTGLGLAAVYGIVKYNDGFINVYSEPTQGTTFKIYLPRFKGEGINSEAISGVSTPKGRGEMVLLVEDEPVVLQMGKRMLERLGYKVLNAGTPEEAIRLAEVHAGEVHLLITDVIMPGMSGQDLAARLQSVYPGLKTLFTSGYPTNVIAHRGVLDQGVKFIQKPFSINALAAAVRTALE